MATCTLCAANYHHSIRVTRYRLIYMVAIRVLSLTLMTTAVVVSGWQSRLVRKSSSLAVLMHGLSGFDRTEIDVRNVDNTYKTAKILRARLEADNEGGLTLVR